MPSSPPAPTVDAAPLGSGADGSGGRDDPGWGCRARPAAGGVPRRNTVAEAGGGSDAAENDEPDQAEVEGESGPGHEDASGAGSGGMGDPRGAGPRSGRRPPRRVDRDRSVVVLGDPAGDGETQPGAARGRAGRAPEAIEDARRSSGATPGPGVVDGEGRRAGMRTTARVTVVVARAVADRVVEQDRDELAQPRRIPDRRRRRRVHLDPHAGVRRGLRQRCGGLGGDVVELERNPLERDGAGVGAGEQEQVVDERGELLDLGVDVGEGVPDLAHRAGGVPPQELDRAPMTVNGVRSSWLASAANSRWRRSAARCPASESRIGTSARRA